MTHKLIISTAAIFALALGTATAHADVPMPECVGNPACQQGSGSGCAVGTLPAGAPVGAAAFALIGAAALLARRRVR